MIISAREHTYQELNRLVRECGEDVTINDCCGERFIGTGDSGKTITINGTPGNALGAYLDGADIVVMGSAQDAVGDTMNDGSIVVNGSAGDALGYAMRGGSIFVRGNAGYRTGIHMKQYNEKCPVIVVGGSAGSFLGEYLAGGIIIVLGLGCDTPPVGNFTGTGMHGGEIWLRSTTEPKNLPSQVLMSKANDEEIKKISCHLDRFSSIFDIDIKEIVKGDFYCLKPNAKNPYKQLYTEN